MSRSSRCLGVVLVAGVIAGLVAGAAATRTGVAVGPAAKKRCHYVVTKVRGKEKRVRVCAKPKPKTADMAVVVTASPNPVTVGSQLTYTITVKNLGPAAATFVDVSFDIPFAGKFFNEYGGGTPSQCSFTDAPPVTLDCYYDTMRAGRSTVITLVATPPVRGEITLDVQVGADQNDPHPKNCCSTVTTTVTGGTCDPSYPDVCIPPPPPDLTCSDIPFTNFKVIYTVPNPDPHHFDFDHDGIGCDVNTSAL